MESFFAGIIGRSLTAESPLGGAAFIVWASSTGL
jgi:hypothetical protein